MTNASENAHRLQAWVVLRQESPRLREALAPLDELPAFRQLLRGAATGQPGTDALRAFLAWARLRKDAGVVASPTFAAVVELARRSLAARTIGDALQ